MNYPETQNQKIGVKLSCFKDLMDLTLTVLKSQDGSLGQVARVLQRVEGILELGDGHVLVEQDVLHSTPMLRLESVHDVH